MTVFTGRFPKVALFDLDGTLLDSAPDFLVTVNRMRASRGIAPMRIEALRPFVSRGSRAMLGAAFADAAKEERESWVPEFLDTYRGEIGKHGVPFDGVEDMLRALENAGARWGIVTNKPEYLAREILPHLGWEARCAVLIGGDTTPEHKPHPLPLLEAMRRIDVVASDCVYVGDDERDIAAARAANLRSIAALWGYRGDDENPAAWGADVAVAQPADLLDPARWP